jgi:hypothetical protein
MTMATLVTKWLVMTLPATMDAVEHYTALAQQAADQAADRAYERRCNAEDAVTFDELLEELTTLSDDAKAEFMRCVASGDHASCSCLFVELSRAKDRVVNRLLAEGN